MRRLERGERAPDFVAPRADGTPTRFYGIAGGKPAVLLFADADSSGLAKIIGALDGTGADAFVVLRGADDPGLGSMVLRDPDGAAAGRYGIEDGQAVAFGLDPNLRIVAVAQLGDGAAVDALLGTLPAAAAGPPVEVTAQAPVLLVPDVLDEAARDRLLATFHDGGNVETGVEQSGSSPGSRADALNPQSKRRRDHAVTDPELLRDLSASVGRRLMPELHKAFAYRANRFEGFKIARYDDQAGGFFAAHRDNLSPATAHRRFALTLNLNDGYEGGHLRFPEYGPSRYRPAAGEALVFSCAHLHEVLPVTRGERFVLLSFLYAQT